MDSGRKQTGTLLEVIQRKDVSDEDLMLLCSFTSPGKMPTVVSPELYRARFCEAMDKYFLMVPDHWTGLGINC